MIFINRIKFYSSKLCLVKYRKNQNIKIIPINCLIGVIYIGMELNSRQMSIIPTNKKIWIMIFS